MLFTTEVISNQEIKDINNFFEQFENSQVETVAPDEILPENNVTKYINSLVSSCYAKSVDDIENTQVGNNVRRKRNLQQIMKQSFFYGANRFGNNFIA